MDSRAFRPGRYLTFRLARHDYAIDAESVRGILPWHDLILADELPRMAETHGYSREVLAGVAAFRGFEIPVVDVAKKLGLPAAPRGRSPQIVVLEAAGFVADAVSEVIVVREREFRRGKIRQGGRPRTVLDPEIVRAAHLAL